MFRKKFFPVYQDFLFNWWKLELDVTYKVENLTIQDNRIFDLFIVIIDIGILLEIKRWNPGIKEKKPEKKHPQLAFIIKVLKFFAAVFYV